MSKWKKEFLYHKVKIWRDSNLKIIFTNGCFDILHRGHVYYLKEAKKLGDKLIIGLNSDFSVSNLKGASRPFMNENDRATILESLSVVDGISIFNEDNPLELIKLLKPDILVKGGDYYEDKIVGAEYVKSLGGEVSIIPFLKGFSSTKIINQLRKV